MEKFEFNKVNIAILIELFYFSHYLLYPKNFVKMGSYLCV